MLEAFLVSTGLVALGEIGDKTQLLSLILAARFRRPWPIVAGIFAATLANHTMAGGLGAWITSLFGEDTMIKVAGASFLAMAVWALIPDKLDEGEIRRVGGGVFWTTVVMFFMAEMGDKTQIATVALAARFHEFFGVVAGTTLGMMIANVPAILLGDRFAHRLPTKLVHGIAAVLFVVLGAMAVMGVGV